MWGMTHKIIIKKKQQRISQEHLTTENTFAKLGKFDHKENNILFPVLKDLKPLFSIEELDEILFELTTSEVFSS